jgi:hypothetical protein
VLRFWRDLAPHHAPHEAGPGRWSIALLDGSALRGEMTITITLADADDGTEIIAVRDG